MRYDKVEVEWVDAFSTDDRIDGDDLTRFVNETKVHGDIKSVGYLVHEDNDVMVLAGENISEARKFTDFTFIPAKSVKHVFPLDKMAL